MFAVDFSGTIHYNVGMKAYALITGASRGIGKEIARELAREGYNLIITANKDSEGLAETALEIKALENAPEVLTFLFNVKNPEEVRALKSELEARGILDAVEVLVNNAGISHFKLIQDETDEDWENVMGINAGGVFNMTRMAVPGMIRKKRGCIVNISSYWGIRGSAMESLYCASKGAVNAFTLSLADELKPSGIRVNALACEFIDTGMNDGFTEEEIFEVLKTMPSHRVITPGEVAKMVSKIVSEDCPLTGRIFGMDDFR